MEHNNWLYTRETTHLGAQPLHSLISQGQTQYAGLTLYVL
jgi:hypothetical protein